MRYTEIINEKKHKRRKHRAPRPRTGFYYGGYMSAAPNTDSDGDGDCDGGGDGGA